MQEIITNFFIYSGVIAVWLLIGWITQLFLCYVFKEELEKENRFFVAVIWPPLFALSMVVFVWIMINNIFTLPKKLERIEQQIKQLKTKK